MALNFPDSPTLNQVYTDSTSGFSYQWNGTVWISYTPASTGNIRVLDDISGSFNGSQNTFALTSSTIALSPPNPQSVIVNLGGVVQDPSDDYTISGSNIIFSTPPTAGLTFSGIVLGVAVPVGISTADAYYRQIYTPTGVQTSFNFVNGYTVGYLDVYHNGAKLVPVTDYTATDGLNFSLITAAQSGDVVEAIGYRVSAVTIVNGNLNSLTVSGISSLAGQTNITSGLNVTGVSTLGSVRISSGIVTASSGIVTYYGDGSNLNLTGNPTAGVSSTSSVFTSGVGTFGVIDGFYPADQKIISVNTSIANGQENISFAEDLVIGAGVTFTVSTGTTVRMDAFSELTPDILNIPDGTTTERPNIPVSGSFRYNNNLDILEFYDGTNWRVVVLDRVVEPTASNVGVFAGGFAAAIVGDIDYINISSDGNATNFGSLTGTNSTLAACSSSTRGVFGGGSTPTITEEVYSTNILIRSSTTFFGNLTLARQSLAACSNSTRGLFGGGVISPATTQNVIDYITIASTGNALDFGDLSQARQSLAACSSSTRGVFGGGITPTPTPTTLSVIDYNTISTTGNSISFGSLTQQRNSLAACSSSTRGIFGGGITSPALQNVLDYITIASTGNAIDFGDLVGTRQLLAACSSITRGVFGGGGAPGNTNVIEYITIASIGDASDFGDLTAARQSPAACSNVHGGLS